MRYRARSTWLAGLLVLLGISACAAIAGLEDKEFHENATAGAAGAESRPPGGGGESGGGANGNGGGGADDSGGANGSGGGGVNGSGGGQAGVGNADGGNAGGEQAQPPSCASGKRGAGRNCGLSADEDCCASILVEGGSFDRFNDPQQPFSVSSFRLDRFEVTVARFREFVAALDEGFRPAPGDGKHVHLEGGAAPGEVGWLAAFDEFLTESIENCPNDNYTASPGVTDKQPIVCASYYHALAFCIWDGGYLPSSTELLYVAVNGDENAPFPWGETLDPSRAVYASSQPADVGTKPAGQGRWGHHDLIGNAWEIVMDNRFYLHGCTEDCAYFDETWDPFAYGASFESSAAIISERNPRILTDGAGDDETGFRCARAP